ncbi:hypothetical protein Lokhon_01994 [Limimaricola hongkongensis DSM 17492]|uniref:Uncharacterized protein n=1 Tax=Limimaricola hongkongensis DSM 17492 TaxID=1122180 RepID=A0A017HCN0_9RHOB|nr:hypothetical protein Lokhon_01994 [Limimaricola hongkongensis DSM 17492]
MLLAVLGHGQANRPGGSVAQEGARGGGAEKARGIRGPCRFRA